MAQSTLAGPIVIAGSLTVTGAMSIPANAVGNLQVSSGSPLDTTKTYHRFNVTYKQSTNANITNDRSVSYVGYSSLGGSIAQFAAGIMNVPVSSNYVTINLLLNGAVISSVNLNSSATAMTPVIASLNTNTYAQYGVLETQVIVNGAGVGTANCGQGVFTQLVLNENP